MKRLDWDKEYSLREFGRKALRYGSIAAVLGGMAFVIVSVAMVEYTAQPKFCTSCHNMVPYYESWAASSHKSVPCIKCHYEPGMIEAVEGKFVALSQIAKYVTRTEGTKPWAEVSDNSCMRSGCHSKRVLWGEISFGRVKFNHRHHLLEARRGRRLRCTTCHSQIVQGAHLTVTTSTCFTCHFLQSDQSSNAGNCDTCHGPPKESLVVAGKPFVHNDWIGRGATCDDCHATVTRGDGAVPRSRCHSCHGEQEHIERYDETEFIHENHVTEHKVECLECHNEIVHSLEPIEAKETAQPAHVLDKSTENCRTCHRQGHSLQAQIFRGVADPGLEAMPSRMSLVRVTCDACHKPFEDTGSDEQLDTAAKVDVACQKCHGSAFQGMLVSWQDEIRGYLNDVEPQYSSLAKRLAMAAPAGEKGAKARALIDEASRRIELVKQDGSNGVHNLAYIRKILEQSMEDLTRAGKLFEPAEEINEIQFRPLVYSDEGCTTSCHVRIEEMDTVTIPTREFPHKFHAADMGLPCSTCHSTEKHGKTPMLESNGCGDCHHTDGADCSKCHDF